MKQVIILSGLPGSGKSTYINSNFPEATVVSADDYFMRDGEYRMNFAELPLAHQACWRRFWEAVQAGHDTVVVDNTNILPEEIAPYVLPAQSAGCDVKIVTLKVSMATSIARNTHGVPPQTIGMMAERLRVRILPPFWTSETVDNEPPAAK